MSKYELTILRKGKVVEKKLFNSIAEGLGYRANLNGLPDYTLLPLSSPVPVRIEKASALIGSITDLLLPESLSLQQSLYMEKN